MDTISELINLETASSILNVNKQTLRRWDESGKLKAVRGENGYRYYEYADLLQHIAHDKARPFVKWAGGKTQLLPQILPLFPKSFNCYIEPFVGGGAVFFTFLPDKAHINDSNVELITTYRVIKKNPNKLIRLLAEHQASHDKEFYYSMRSLKTETLDDIEVAGRFIYLNKTCFNGLYRVNQKGEFNVPIGSYSNPKIVDEGNIISCSKALKNTEIHCKDYREFLDEFVESGDLIYLDPPYIPVSEYSDFDRYSKEKFRIQDQIELSTYYKKMIERGAYPILSNSSSVFTEKFYSSYELKKVEATRSINKDGNKRGKIEEYIVVPEVDCKKSFFPSTRYMGSKNNLLENISAAIAPLKVKTIFDAFSGSGVVSYHLKSLGYRVISNDFLKYSSTITKAVVENKNVNLASDEIGLLLSKNRKAGNFVSEKFKDLYFSDEDNEFLDNTLANIELLTCEYKKSLALASLSRACLKRRPRGIFTYVGFKYDDNRKDLSFSLREHFIFSISEFNQAVFDNKRENTSINKSILDLDKVTADLIYLDPPYFSKHSDNDYIRRYHFIEGLCRNWRGVEIQEETLTKKFKKYDSPFNTKEGTYRAFEQIFERYKDSKILISYSSNSLPTKDELVNMLGKYKKKVEVIEIDYKYSFGNQGHKVEENNNDVKEYLFLGI